MKRYTIKKKSRSGAGNIDYDTLLNEQQRAVVTAGAGPMLVIAGAGSGKTHTLTYRVAHLVDRGVAPENILLLTFTNKSARAMIERVSDLLNINATSLWGGTFHSVGNRILRREATRLGYGEEYGILDSQDAATLMRACVADAKVGHLEKHFPRGGVLTRIYSYCANTQRTVEEILADQYPHFEELAESIRRVFRLYQTRKLEMSLMDFDDLLINWKILMQTHPEVLREYAAKFEHILVDEYQDTNHLQGEIIDLMASIHENLMVVGDDCQSIYAFRGADYRNILEFPQRYERCRVYKLETNYRSTPEILDLANASIHFNENQFQKTLVSARDAGERPALIKLRGVSQQAEFVCQRILELADEGQSLDQMAVLYRSHHHALELQVEMTRAKIPYVVRSGIRFFEQAHIKDVLSYLKFLFNPRDEISFMRMAGQWRGIGSKRSQDIWMYVQSQPDPMSAITDPKLLGALPKRASASWSDASKLLGSLRDKRLTSSPSQLIDSILGSKFRDHLQRTYDKPDNRLADLEQLSVYSDSFNDIDHFLGEISLLSGLSGQEILVGGDKPDEYVTLSSIHQSKGLEWTTVFGLWLSEGQFPGSRAETQEEIEEERRLFYVMATRAREELYLCQPMIQQGKSGRRTVLRESQFIEELRYLKDGQPKPFEEWLVDG
ncbi:ATP-dependent helicase [Bradymonas sediminis]|uniref:DNA 3'-5' helicase n=1 Tax=Bradymonas sediminis TaxID=1548548 RepID=A0A2Z4FL09_9DELT|nr:ATP-dependent helicase [Bradymonas sediminis]AWV89633.1 ATP-dependent helicase [Bradymonas sediminis]TDP76627.1 DNA helicase-2/ATP-dependent DNA helicase PcrA [Bradymonas sediminis]